MKVLDIGGAGFIGSNFMRYILDNISNITVINLDDLKYGSNPANLSDLENDSRYSFLRATSPIYPRFQNSLRHRRNSKLRCRDSRGQEHLRSGSISAEQCFRCVNHSLRLY